MFLKLTENFLEVGAIFGTSSMLLLVGVYQVSTDKSFTVPTINCLFTQKAMYTSLGHKYGLRLHQEHSIYPYMMNQGVKTGLCGGQQRIAKLMSAEYTGWCFTRSIGIARILPSTRLVLNL